MKVIYFGDHLFSDLKGPAKAGWRTAAVIRELEVLTILPSATQLFCTLSDEWSYCTVE